MSKGQIMMITHVGVVTPTSTVTLTMADAISSIIGLLILRMYVYMQ